MGIGRGVSLYSMYDIFDPGRTGTAMLSKKPERLREAATRLIVERLTWSSRASPFQSGRTMRVAGSMRRSSAASIWSPRSNGNVGGRPLGAPVALCGFLTISKYLSLLVCSFPQPSFLPDSARSIAKAPKLRKLKFKKSSNWCGRCAWRAQGRNFQTVEFRSDLFSTV